MVPRAATREAPDGEQVSETLPVSTPRENYVPPSLSEDTRIGISKAIERWLASLDKRSEHGGSEDGNFYLAKLWDRFLAGGTFDANRARDIIRQRCLAADPANVFDLVLFILNAIHVNDHDLHDYLEPVLEAEPYEIQNFDDDSYGVVAKAIALPALPGNEMRKALLGAVEKWFGKIDDVQTGDMAKYLGRVWKEHFGAPDQFSPVLAGKKIKDVIMRSDLGEVFALINFLEDFGRREDYLRRFCNQAFIATHAPHRIQRVGSHLRVVSRTFVARTQAGELKPVPTDAPLAEGAEADRRREIADHWLETMFGPPKKSDGKHALV
jgi:hypothetical protein